MKKQHLLGALLVCIVFVKLQAQFTTLHSFNSIAGGDPDKNVIISGHMLFGTTQYGGANGTGVLFSIHTDGNGYKVIWNFDRGGDSNGAYSYGALLLLGGKLFGTTISGGLHSAGNVYRIDTNGSAYHDLWDFQFGNHLNAAWPIGNLVLSGNYFYEMTAFGGVNSTGNIYRIDTNGNGYSTLWSFDHGGDTNGSGPTGSLILLGGKLYGMTQQGGVNSDGNIFSIDLDGTNYHDLWNFDGGGDTNGSLPLGSLISIAGKLYGMTRTGGIHSDGNIFCIDTDGSNYRDMWDFNLTGDTNGAIPYGNLQISGNLLYGMTQQGGTQSDGNIFSIDTNGKNYRDLWDLSGINGKYPNGDITFANHVMFGMTYSGGLLDSGTIFSLVDTNVHVATNIKELTSIKCITIFPNPNNGIFTIQSSGVMNNSTVEVYNVLGKKVYTAMLKQVQHDYGINLSNQPAGIYQYRALNNEGSLIGEGTIIIK